MSSDWRRCLSELAIVARNSGHSSFLLLFSSSRPPTLSPSSVLSLSLLSRLRRCRICHHYHAPGRPQRTDTVTNTNEQRTDYCILSTTLFSQARCRRTLDHLSHLSDTAHCAYSKDTCFKSYILEGVGNCQLIVQSVSINICGSSGMSIVQLIEVKLISLETSSSDRYSYHT